MPTSSPFHDGLFGPEIREKLNAMWADWLAALESAVGKDGWSPLLRVVADGTRQVIQLYDWIGGTPGTKPTQIGYMGASGLVIDIAQAVNFRGTDGTDGDDGIDGLNGWTPLLRAEFTAGRTPALVIHLYDWQGGTGAKPAQTGYMGEGGLVQDAGDAYNFRGPVGSTPTVVVGTVTTGAPGTPVEINPRGSPTALILDFKIPQGVSGTGTGDVIGPAAAEDLQMAQFDGLTGKLIRPVNISGILKLDNGRPLIALSETDYATPQQVADKQDRLVSGFNIKSINSVNILGVGDASVQWKAVAIPSGANLNNYQSEGAFFVAANATAASLLNSPTVNAFNMQVYKGGGWIQEITEFIANNTRRSFQRAFYAGTWSAWARIYTTIDPQTETAYLGLANGTDLNGIVTPGFYLSGSTGTSQTITNKPPSMDRAFGMEVLNTGGNGGSGPRLRQVVTSYSATKNEPTWIRSGDAEAWSPWVMQYDADNSMPLKTVNGQALAGTGDITIAGSRDKRFYFHTANTTLIVPAGVTVVRFYAGGNGGNGGIRTQQVGLAGGGGGGGFAFGDLDVTAGDTVAVTISAGVTTVRLNGVVIGTANPGSNGGASLNSGAGGAGGTATISGVVTNGGAYAGGAGGTATGGGTVYTGAGGGSCGSPLGNGFTGGSTTTGGSSGGAAGAGIGGSGAPGLGGGGGGAGEAGTATYGGGSTSDGSIRGLVDKFTDPLLADAIGGRATTPLMLSGVGGFQSSGGDFGGGAGGPTGGTVLIGYKGGLMAGGGGNGGAATGVRSGGNGGYGGGGGGLCGGGGSSTTGIGGPAFCFLYY